MNRPRDLLPGPRQYTDAPELTSSRLRLFTCQRADHYYVAKPLRVQRRSPVQSPTGSVRGGGILSFIPPLSIGCPEDFCATFPIRRNDSQANDLRRKRSLNAIVKGVARATGDSGPTNAAVQSPQASPKIEW